MLAHLYVEKWVYRTGILISKYFYCVTHSDVTSHCTGESQTGRSHEKEECYLCA